MTNPWRLTAEVTAIITSPYTSNSIYLCSPEKKQYKKLVEKFIEKTQGTCEKKEVNIDLNEFDLKVEINQSLDILDPSDFFKKVDVYIKSEQLPSDEWYLLKNAYKPGIVEILLYNSSNNGVLDGKFEATFNSNDITCELVSFSSDKMPSYRTCFEEFKRRLNCELHPKTKKFVEGKKYDTPEESRYYLGKLYSRKLKDNKSTFLTNLVDMPEVYLYVNELMDGEKSISDILKNRVIGTNNGDIKISRTFSPMVETSDSITNDVSEILDYIPEIIKRSASSIDIKDGYVNKLEPLSLASTTVSKITLEKISEAASELYGKIIEQIILSNYDIIKGNSSMVMSSSKTLEENAVAGFALFVALSEDCNINRAAYYEGLFKEFKVDVNSIAVEKLKIWNPDSFLADINTFVSNRDYFRIRSKRENTVFCQREKSTHYRLAKSTLKSKYGEGELTEVIKKVIESARNNYGQGIETFETYNVGTKREPKEYVSATISLENIINYCGGVSSLTSELEKEILLNKFTYCTIDFDKDIKEIE